MVHFMDIAEEEMQKNASQIRLPKLESLLEISLRITSANSDPFKDDLKVKLMPTDLKTMMMRLLTILGDEYIHFSFHVKLYIFECYSPRC